MTRKIKLYMAHPFGSRHLIREWEQRVEKELGIEILNPFYDCTIENPEPVDNKKIDVFKWMKATDSEKVVSKDITHIADCDGVIAYIDGSTSYGTIMEIVYARIMHKKVYLVVTNNYEDHPWLREHADVIYTSLEHMEHYLSGVVNRHERIMNG